MKNLIKKNQKSNTLPRHSFSYNCARLHIRRVRQNTFFTVTDLSNRVVAALSLGLLTPSRNKRVKLAATTLERVHLRIRSILRLNSVNQVTLLLRSLIPRWQLRKLQRTLLLQNIRIIAVDWRRLAIHGSLRAPHLPRK
jgi:hypothetical protein